MTIPKEFIGAVIGPGGKIIQGMQEETGATITIEEIDGVGRIEVAGTNKKCIDDAMRMIKSIVAVPEIGETYMGKVRSVMPYGVFVEFLPGKDGLLHISEIDWKRLDTIEESGLKEGDEIEVKLLDIDPKTGKFKLWQTVNLFAVLTSLAVLVSSFILLGWERTLPAVLAILAANVVCMAMVFIPLLVVAGSLMRSDDQA